LKGIKGVDKVMISGLTAFVTTKTEDTKFNRGIVNKAFAKSGVTVESVGTKTINTPKEAYKIAVKGGT